MSTIESIVNCIKANHYSAQYIADRTGLDRKTVASIINGESDNPRIQTLEAIAQVLDGQVKFETNLGSYSAHTADVSYYVKMIADKQQIIDEMHSERELQAKVTEQQLKQKDTWIWRLFCLCIGLMLVAVFMAANAF